MIDTIMIFAAGKGTRMQHITAHQPKCLINIAGKPILHHLFEFILQYPFKKIIINTHYLPEQIENSIKEFETYNITPEIITIHEPVLLETGGGIKNAINLIGNDPIFTINSDIIINSKINIFQYMASSWEPDKMDFLLLLQPFEDAIGYKGKGDFDLLEEGLISRLLYKDHYDYMYAGLNILKPRLITSNQETIFSLREYYMHNNKLYGNIIPKVRGIIAPHCRWYHATSPQDIIEIENELAKAKENLKNNSLI